MSNNIAVRVRQSGQIIPITATLSSVTTTLLGLSDVTVPDSANTGDVLVYDSDTSTFTAARLNISYLDSIIDQVTTSNTSLVTSYGIKTYIDNVAAANVSITGGIISNVSISNLISSIGVNDGGTGLSTLTENGVMYASNTTSFAFATGEEGSILQITNNLPTFGGLDGGAY